MNHAHISPPSNQHAKQRVLAGEYQKKKSSTGTEMQNGAGFLGKGSVYKSSALRGPELLQVVRGRPASGPPAVASGGEELPNSGKET